MMTDFTIFFIDRNNRTYDSCDFSVGEDDSFFYALSNALYIHQELRPVARDWMRELALSTKTQFTYHGTEFTTIYYHLGSSYIIAYDD